MEARYLPDADATTSEMVKLQRRVAEEAEFCGHLKPDDVKLAGGVDQAFEEEEIVSAAVVLEDEETVDQTAVHRRIEYPYVPGLLAFREAPAVVEAIRTLDIEPEVLLVDGSGRIHPRQAGLATHVGVVLDIPAVGVAKSLLCGSLDEPVDRLEEGERVAVRAGKDVEADEDTVIGYAYQSRQYDVDASTSVNPLYVSPGHMVDAEAAVDVVERYCTGYKLPEPVRQADALAERSKSS